MTTLLWILLATLVAGLLSMLAAAWLSMSALVKLVRQLVSLSAGLLLGTSILHLLPEAFESGADAHALAWTLLFGLIGFFVLEKASILRHSHHHEGDGHDHHHGHDSHEAGRGGMLILVGDSIHNFADGVMIAAAFLADVRLGWITTLAIVAHEIPQEIGDFIVLLNAGYTRTRAFLFNGLASLACTLGGVVGFFALASSRDILPFVIIVSAASFIYIALADLIPDMQRHHKRNDWVMQLVMLAAGIVLIAVVTSSAHQH